MFRSAVPERLRFWLIILIPIIFQMSDAVFMGLATEISSELSLLREDILYCGFAGMIGVTMTFPLLFRLKFRFTSRSIFLITSLGMAAICFACIYIRCVPVLVAFSFLFGCLKLWGSFEAFSSIMLKVAPRYNFAPFLAVVFTIVFGSIELSGIVGKVIIYFTSWEYMSYLMIGCLLLVAAMAYFAMIEFRPMPAKSLAGIDWTGMLLWGVTLLGFAFVFVYGNSFDWFNSEAIWMAVGVIIVSLGINLARMSLIDNPYICFKAFSYRNMGTILVIFLIGAVMMSAESVLQHIYVGEILGHDSYSQTSLSIAALVGVCAGGWCGYYAIEKAHIGFKRMTFLSILVLTMYEICMSMGISPEMSLGQLYLPMFFYGFGHVLLFVSLTTYIEGVVPLEHRFQALTILGFVRIGCGSAYGSALLGQMFSGAVKYNIAQLGSNVNSDMISVVPMPMNQIAATISRQAVMVSLKELYAFCVLLGIITMIIIAMANYRRSVKLIYPALSTVYRTIFRVQSGNSRKPA